MKNNLSAEYVPLNKLKNYHSRMRACWMGKAVGGAIGAPCEGVPGPQNLKPDIITFDTVAPNDDLELQLLWLVFAERYGLELNSKHLSEAWTDWIGYGMDEYGVAIRNLKRGIMPPYSGYVDNWFADGMGAAIRSEIWACLFPGNPGMAARYAAYDAMVDHHRDGVCAEMFWAATESSAFLEYSTRRSMETALKYIPGDSRVSQAVNFMFDQYDAKPVGSSLPREFIMQAYGSHNFADCIMNLCFSVAALLWHENFADRVVAAVNFGMDTDCTAATVGAITAIEQGAEAIPESWRKCAAENIEISEFLKRPEIPRTVEALSRRVEKLVEEKFADELAGRECPLPEYEPVSANWPVPTECKSQWLALPLHSDEDFQAVPERVFRAVENPASMLDSMVEFPGQCIKASGLAPAHSTIFWLTFLTVDEDYDQAQLMVCANTGLTTWFDGKQVINYHGRLPMLPAFHRTEGGATVPVKLKKGVPIPSLIRLLWSHDPIEICVGIANINNQHIISAKFTVPGA